MSFSEGTPLSLQGFTAYSCRRRHRHYSSPVFVPYDQQSLANCSPKRNPVFQQPRLPIPSPSPFCIWFESFLSYTVAITHVTSILVSYMQENVVSYICAPDTMEVIGHHTDGIKEPGTRDFEPSRSWEHFLIDNLRARNGSCGNSWCQVDVHMAPLMWLPWCLQGADYLLWLP